MLFNHTFATRRKFGVIDADDNASDSNLDNRVEQNSGYVPRLVNLNYAPTALHAFAAGQEPIPQADYPSISSNFIATTSAESFSTIEGFSNIDGDLVTHVVYSPPDNGLAISDNGYIISVVNDTIGWYDPNFSTKMQFEAFSRFFSGIAGEQTFFFDPQVLYDASHGKFIVTEDSYSTQSNILIAVSHDASPTGYPNDWDFFSINSQYTINGKVTAADYPQSDIDGINLFITSDQFRGNKYFGSVITKISLSDIEYGPADSINYSHFIANTPIKETLDVAGNPGKGAFFVGYDGYSKRGSEYVTIAYYDEDTGKTTVYDPIKVGDIDNTNVQTLVATEPDGYLLDASDRRITDVKVIDGHLFAVTEVASNTTKIPNVHWFEFGIPSDPHKSPFLIKQGDILGSDILGSDILGSDILGTEIGTEVSTLNGSITGDSQYLVLNFTATGPNLNPSDYFAVSTDGGHHWEIQQYQTSNLPFSDGGKVSRWGDYSSAVVDSTQEHAFLISNEYAIDTSSHWGTVIADLSLDSNGNAVNPAPADMLPASMMATAPNASGLDGSTALLTQYMGAEFQDGFDNGSGGYTASPTSEAIFGEAPLLTKPTT